MKKLLNILIIFLLLATNSQLISAQEYKPMAIKMHNQGVLCYDKKQYDEALNCFEEAVSIDPNFIDSYYNMAVLYEYNGELTKAVAAYKNMLRIDNYNQDAAYKIAEIYSRQKNYTVALNYLKLVPEASSKYPAAMILKKKVQAKIK